MKKEYNEQAFTPKDVENGLHLKLITTLLDINHDLEDRYNDIHITSDGYCTIIQWCESWYDKSDSARRFDFIDDDDVIMKDICFPDNHYEQLYADQAQEVCEEWLKNNPDYNKYMYVPDGYYFTIKR